MTAQNGRMTVEDGSRAAATSGPRLIGGEMLLWSDLDGTHGPGPAGGPALAAIFNAARGRVLVAGPHDPALLDGLNDATVLVRGIPDAEALAARPGAAAGEDRPGLTVLCGGPAKLAAEAPFDTVIALAGLERLGTAEDDELTWADTLALLRGALKPDGVLVLGVENPMGVQRLVAPPGPLTDADWTPGADDTRPATADELRAAAGAVSRIYCAYPDAVQPQVLLPEGAAGGVVEAAIARAYTGVGETVVDPATLAIDSVRHGLGLGLAPGWIILGAADEQALPDIAGDAGFAGGSAPVGPTLESTVLRAAVRRELPMLRELLTAWQSSPVAGVDAGQVIRTEDGTLTALSEPVGPGPALRALASRLLRGGLPHPWPNVRGVSDLAVTLATMAGLDESVAEGAEAGEPSQPLPFTELVSERERLVRELTEAREQAAFFETELNAREEDVRRLRRTVELLSGKGAARAGQAFVGGVRAARRVLRRLG